MSTDTSTSEPTTPPNEDVKNARRRRAYTLCSLVFTAVFTLSLIGGVIEYGLALRGPVPTALTLAAVVVLLVSGVGMVVLGRQKPPE